MENMGLPTCRGCGGVLACTCASDKANLQRKLEVAREALETIDLLSTNHGGWFDQPGQQFKEYRNLGKVAQKALKEISDE